MIKTKKPHGRDEVVTALIRAAAELFSEKGVEAVSLRKIAVRAGVNHGLIHRHFGSKEALRR
ncbi:MAG: helix-turn-helix domain-containing protein, partial [Desulfobacterales bacterium]